MSEIGDGRVTRMIVAWHGMSRYRPTSVYPKGGVTAVALGLLHLKWVKKASIWGSQCSKNYVLNSSFHLVFFHVRVTQGLAWRPSRRWKRGNLYEKKTSASPDDSKSVFKSKIGTLVLCIVPKFYLSSKNFLAKLWLVVRPRSKQLSKTKLPPFERSLVS